MRDKVDYCNYRIGYYAEKILVKKNALFFYIRQSVLKMLNEMFVSIEGVMSVIKYTLKKWSIKKCFVKNNRVQLEHVLYSYSVDHVMEVSKVLTCNFVQFFFFKASFWC